MIQRLKGRSILLILVLLAFHSIARAVGSGFPLGESQSDKVDKIFAQWNKPDSPGCEMAVIKDGQILYKRGYGMANLEHNIPMSPASIMDTGSVSKQFTAMAIALLAEQGKLSLDDDIRKYLPEIPKYESTITIRHLIHHTSGIRDYLTLMAIAGMRDDDYYVDGEVLSLLGAAKGVEFQAWQRVSLQQLGILSPVADRQARVGKNASRVCRRKYIQAARYDPYKVLR